jgi:type II secretory pathway pseudopilin PulG
MRRARSSAFTLFELILVMVLLAIAAAILVPSLSGFVVSRQTDAAVMQVVSLAQYARNQAVSEGRFYRLNYDTQKNQVWITMLDAPTDTYVSPNNEFGKVVTLPAGMKMDVDVFPQPNTLLVVPSTVQQNTVSPSVPYGQLVATMSNAIVENVHDKGTYTEFQPSGRTDPTHVRLTDKAGREIDLGCATALESLHVLSAREMK